MKMSDCRMQSPPMRGERCRARRVWVAFACAAVFVVAQLLPMKTAYAADNWQSVWNHQSLDEMQQFIVGAYNTYDAAAYACGYDSAVVGAWDLQTRAKLSSGDNAFARLAQAFASIQVWNGEGLDTGLEEYFGSSLWQKMQSVRGVVGGGGLGFVFNHDGISLGQVSYWAQNMPDGLSCYAVNVSDSDLQDARTYVEHILSGGGSSVGGSEVVGDNVVFSMPTLYAYFDNPNNNVTMNNAGPVINGQRYLAFSAIDISRWNQQVGTSYVQYPAVTTYSVPKSVFGDLIGNYDFIAAVDLSTTGGNFNVPVLAVEKGSWNSEELSYSSGGNYNKVTPYVRITTSKPYYLAYFYTSFGNVGELSYKYVWSRFTRYESGYLDLPNNNPLSGVGVSVPVEIDEPTGPGDWPDPPVNPTPTPPNPPDPTPNPPAPDPPANPTPYTPPTYTPIGVTAPTDTTDVIPWLRAILDQLKAIQTDMANHCQHIQDAISENADRIIETISSRVEWMADVLDGMFETLTDNICDTLRWLARQMQFDQTEPYNDTSLLYWIRKIYARLGNNPINPVNPAEPGGGEQGFDFWAWLIGMLSNLIGGVLGDASDAVQMLLEGIQDKFPFSIPWDLMGILALLDAPRQTPDLTVTIPAINGWWEPIEFDLDLAPYDDVAAAMRAMAMIWWVAELIKRTNWMLDDVLGSVTTKLIGGPVGKLTGAV